MAKFADTDLRILDGITVNDVPMDCRAFDLSHWRGDDYLRLTMSDGTYQYYRLEAVEMQNAEGESFEATWYIDTYRDEPEKEGHYTFTAIQAVQLQQPPISRWGGSDE
jgi:hypothetical protein